MRGASWKNCEGEIIENGSWRNNHGGTLEHESWGGIAMEEEC